MLPDVIIDLIEDYLLAMSGAGECPKPKVIRRLINKSNRAFAKILGVEYPTALHHHHYVNDEIKIPYCLLLFSLAELERALNETMRSDKSTGILHWLFMKEEVDIPLFYYDSFLSNIISLICCETHPNVPSLFVII
jgi:hypothetical protein